MLVALQLLLSVFTEETRHIAPQIPGYIFIYTHLLHLTETEIHKPYTVGAGVYTLSNQH